MFNMPDEKTTPQRRRTAFFKSDEPVLDALPSVGRTVPARVTAALDVDSYLRKGFVSRPLSVDVPENAPSLIEYSFQPNFVVPRHHHDTDQIVLVLEGNLKQGNRELGPGDGYFTPAGTTYSVSAGEEGCRFVEFRTASAFHTTYVEDDPNRWSIERD